MKLFTSAMKTVIAAASVTAALTTVATLRCFHRRLAAPETGSRTPFDLTQAPSLALSQAWLMVSRREWCGRSLQELDPRAPPNTRRGEFGEAGRQAAEYPPLRTSTVMFLHIFKCAGSTLRRMLVNWAIERGESGALVVSCSRAEREDKICLDSHELLDEAVQKEIMSRQKVIAGHFLWGFQRYVEGPYLMITSLRNPLEVYVSGRQFLHPDQTTTLDQAQAFVSGAMREVLGIDASGAVGDPTERAASATGLRVHRRRSLPSPSGRDERKQMSGRDERKQIRGFIFRLSGDDKTKLHGEALLDATHHAIENLRQFWVVGIVEQYAGFMEVLKRLLDPEGRHEALWEKYSRRQLNSSPVGSRDVLAAIDPELVGAFNDSLALQWQVYERGVSVWDARCREVLPPEMHQDLCIVGPALSVYS